MKDASKYVSGEYIAEHPDWHQTDSPWKASQISKIIDRNQVSVKNVVEIGCGAGRIIHELSKVFSDEVLFQGYDISPQAIEIARKYEKSNVSYKCLDFIEEGVNVVDLLLVIDVFEHIEDYMGFLRKLRNRASFYVFHIPLDMNIQGLIRDKQIVFRNDVGHLHYFSKATALRTVKDTGYEVIDWFYTRSSIGRASEHNWGIRSTIANIPRRLIFPIFPDLTVKLLGGFSMMVLTK